MDKKSIGAKKSRSLFVLMVGIADYSEKFGKLPGSINDITDLEAYLTSYCKNKKHIVLDIRKLENEKATRSGVIEAFSHFDAAENDDICLFYFTGHGSRKIAPNEFRVGQNEYNETMVCYDIGQEDYMLIDKELSYLIAKYSHGKENLHFLVVSDCCHSGSNSKSVLYKTKTVPIDKKEKKLLSYYGYEDYLKNKVDGKLKVSSPIGNHLHLAACHSSQKALQRPFEVEGKTIYRSIFTHSLLQVLKDTDGKLSYQSLINKIKVHTKSLAPDQTPQLAVIGLDPKVKKSSFLEGILDNAEPIWQVSYDSREGWIINIGSIHGLTSGDIVVLESAPVQLSKINTNYSKLLPSFTQYRWMNQKNIYDASILFNKHQSEKIKLTFSPDCADIAKDLFSKILSEKQSPYVDLVYDGAGFVIHARENYFALAYPDSLKPIFKRVFGFNTWGGILFLNQIETMAKWFQITKLNAKKTTINEKDILVTLERVNEPFRYNYSDLSTIEEINTWDNDNIFRYHYEILPGGSLWHGPAFRLKITNTSTQKIWVGALYCGSDFDFNEDKEKTLLYSITSRFLEPVILEAGKSIYLEDVFINPTDQKKSFIKTISLHVLDDYFDQGYNEINDIIKVFASRDEFDLAYHNLKGLEMDPLKMSIVRPAMTEREMPSNWRSFDIPITIVRPKDHGKVPKNGEIDLGALSLKEHPDFSANLILSTFKELKRGVSEKNKVILPPQDYFSSDLFELFEITEGLGEIEGRSVIEMYNGLNIQSVSKSSPVILKINESLSESECIIPIGYAYRKKNYYQKIGYSEGDHVYINKLPNSSPSAINEMGNSIKVLFIKGKANNLKQLKV